MGLDLGTIMLGQAKVHDCFFSIRSPKFTNEKLLRQISQVYFPVFTSL